MNAAVSDIFTTISAMRSMVENFPNGILTTTDVYTMGYSSITEFLLQLLRGAGLTDRDIIEFILKDLFGIENNRKWQDNVHAEIAKLPEAELNCKFLQVLDTSVKDVIAAILSELISCSLIPKVRREYCTEGFNVPVGSIDPMSMLRICPTEPMGRNIYQDITDEDTPSTMTGATDLNAFLWCVLYNADGDWKKRGDSGTTICHISNSTENPYEVINVKMGQNYLGKSLYYFNKDYLENLDLFSPKALITYLFDEMVNGLQAPSLTISAGLKDVINWGTVSTIVKKELENIEEYEYTGNDCAYTFSNDDWNKMMTEYELRKFSAQKSSTYGGAVQVDRDTIMSALNDVSTAATKADALYRYETMLFDLSGEGWTDTTTETNFSVVANLWINNIAINLIKPILRTVLTPKVLTLILINYQAAGLLNLDDVNWLNSTAVLDLLRKKMLLLIRKLIWLIVDSINKALIDLFEAYIKPLVLKYHAKLTMEKIRYYTLLLESALECYKLYGGYTFADIGDVNYADIVPEKINPEQTICDD